MYCPKREQSFIQVKQSMIFQVILVLPVFLIAVKFNMIKTNVCLLAFHWALGTGLTSQAVGRLCTRENVYHSH